MISVCVFFQISNGFSCFCTGRNFKVEILVFMIFLIALTVRLCYNGGGEILFLNGTVLRGFKKHPPASPPPAADFLRDSEEPQTFVPYRYGLLYLL